MIRRTSTLGFSLLELSVVLGIIALITGAGVTLGSGALKAADRVSTQERLNTIKMALDSYAKTYGYLPCPADRGMLLSNANFGKERRAGVACTVSGTGLVAVAATTAYIGGLPVRTLGLPDTYAGDAWGDKFTYAVTANHVRNAVSYAQYDGALTVRYGDRTGTNYPITTQRVTSAFTSAVNNGGGAVRLSGVASTIGLAVGNIVHVAGGVYKGSYSVSAFAANSTIDLTGSTYSATDTGNVTWLTPGAGASYVVVSHGPDKRGAFPFSGIAVPAMKACIGAANESPPPCNFGVNSCNDIENCDNADTTFYDTIYNDGTNPAQYFDDYVVWGTNAEARSPVNPNLYATCGTGTYGGCESWCAPCTKNYPGNPASFNPNTFTLCSKIVYGSSSSCTAACMWSGTIIAGGAYQRCP